MLKTLKTGLDMLRYVAVREGAVQAAEIAEAFDISLGKTYNVIRTLVEEGMLERSPNGALRLGVYAGGLRHGLMLGSGADGVDPAALLEQVNDLTGETTYISLLLDTRVVITRIAEGKKGLRVGGLHEGYGEVPHARAAARALLAYLPEPEVQSVVGPEPYAALTDRTPTSFAALEVGLQRVRTIGYAAEIGEYQEDVACVSVPLLSVDRRPIASLSVSGPSTRLASRLDEVGIRLVALTRGVNDGSRPTPG